MSTAPIEPPKKPSLMFLQDMPASSVFQTPPPVEPTRNMCGWAVKPATAVDRPPRNGPSRRKRRLLKRSVSALCADAVGRAAVGDCWAWAEPAVKTAKIAKEVRARVFMVGWGRRVSRFWKLSAPRGRPFGAAGGGFRSPLQRAFPLSFASIGGVVMSAPCSFRLRRTLTQAVTAGRRYVLRRSAGGASCAGVRTLWESAAVLDL